MTRTHRTMRGDDLARIFLTDTLADAGLHTRIHDAITRLDDAQTPLRASNPEAGTVTGGGDTTDPAGELATTHAMHGDPQRDTRNRLQRLVLDRHDIDTEIAAICNEWAPRQAPATQTAAANLTIWCVNHLTHGHMEPRATNGSQHCAWCRDIKSRYGSLPTGELVKLHAKRGKIDDATYRRLLPQRKKKKPAA